MALLETFILPRIHRFQLEDYPPSPAQERDEVHAAERKLAALGWVEIGDLAWIANRAPQPSYLRTQALLEEFFDVSAEFSSLCFLRSAGNEGDPLIQAVKKSDGELYWGKSELREAIKLFPANAGAAKIFVPAPWAHAAVEEATRRMTAGEPLFRKI